MTATGWDEVLDAIEHALDVVEDALAADEPIPDLPAFDPPEFMPTLSDAQRVRADALMRRQAATTVDVSAQIVSAQIDLGQLRRRRRAAVAYGRHG